METDLNKLLIAIKDAGKLQSPELCYWPDTKEWVCRGQIAPVTPRQMGDQSDNFKGQSPLEAVQKAAMVYL